jgi:preprotein translocase subunit Sec63
VQSLYYGITIRAGDPKPAPGSPIFAKHYRRIRITLIVLYLLYTVYEASQIMQRKGDFYQLLGVTHNMDEKGIKGRFRRL